MKKYHLLALPLVPAALTLSASAQFTVQYLGSFGPAVTQRMNNSGQVAGDAQISSLTTAIRYTPGVGVVARTIPAGSGLSYAFGINNAGACVGQIAPPGGGAEYAAVWDAGNVLTGLPMPRGGTWSYNTAADINDSDVVCGFVTQAVVGADPQTAWRWSAGNGYTMLPQLGGNYSFARDINASGAICGYSGPTEDGPMHAVVWSSSNVIQDLGLVGTATQTFANAINDAGVVVGSSDNGTPWKYTPGIGMVALPRLAGSQNSTHASAQGVNNAGWVVGYANQSGEPHTVVWDPAGVIYKIEDYAGPDFYFPADESYPIAINDNNDLVVYAYDFSASGDPLAVRFHFGLPQPCPADVNSDHSVNVNDLLAVITAWGACANPNNCPADIVPPGGNDQVDVNDLLAVITAWGACP